MGPAARRTRRTPHIGQRVRRQGETGRTPTWKRRERLSPVRNTSGFSSAPVPRRSKENAGGGRCESKRSDGNWIGFGLNPNSSRLLSPARLLSGLAALSEFHGSCATRRISTSFGNSVRQDRFCFTGYNISFSMTSSAKRFTPIRRSRASPAPRVARCKAASSYSTELSRATSLTRSMS